MVKCQFMEFGKKVTSMVTFSVQILNVKAPQSQLKGNINKSWYLETENCLLHEPILIFLASDTLISFLKVYKLSELGWPIILGCKVKIKILWVLCFSID